MSEYQYHEWQTVERLLTPEEQDDVSDLSSHIEVSPSGAVVTYNWGDFRYDPFEVLAEYFDGYFYLTNWGSVRLAFRFPAGMLDMDEIRPYCCDDSIRFIQIGAYQVLDLDFNPEGDNDWGEQIYDASLSDFIQLRADLLEGDYRLLYLAWLKAKTIDGWPDAGQTATGAGEDRVGDNPFEPPVPAGLKKLTAELRNFVRVFGVEPNLVRAASENSPELKKKAAIDYRSLVEKLSRSECDDFLTRLAENNPSTAVALRKRLNEFLPRLHKAPAALRTLRQLISRAEEM